MKRLRKKIKGLEEKKLIYQMLIIQVLYLAFIVIKITQKDYAGAFLFFSINCSAGYYLVRQYKKIVRNNRRMKENEKALQAFLKESKECDKTCFKCENKNCPRSKVNTIHIYLK